MSQPKPTPDAEARLSRAYAQRAELMQSLLDMNGGDPNIYAAMGRNEGYDSLLCSLRSTQAVIEELGDAKETNAKAG